MRRELDRLREGSFDLLVVGGGIYGAWTAYDAALRGLRVALVEARDFASGTSSGSSKLVHGGLRYLEQLDLRLVRRSLAERARLARLGPHRVTPLRFVVPVRDGERVGMTRLGLGLWLYDRLAGSRSDLRPRQRYGARELRERFPFLAPEGLRGGYAYGDRATDDARLVLEIASGAGEAGAVVLNHAPVRALLGSRTGVEGASVEDLETGATLEVRARLTALCAGAWNERLLATAGLAPEAPLRRTKGVHLVMPPLGTDAAFLLPTSSDRRVVFLIPWYGRTLLGTTDTDFEGSPDEVTAGADDERYLLDVAERALGPNAFGPGDVISRFAALRTLVGSGSRAPSAVSREWSIEAPATGLLVSLGGKLTSARADASGIVDRAMGVLGRATEDRPTETRPFPWAPADPGDGARLQAEALVTGVPADAAALWPQRYGSRADRLVELVRHSPELAVRIVPDAPFALAEAVWAVTAEGARTLNDVLRRRIPLTLVSRVDRAAAGRVAACVAPILGWPPERVERELAPFEGVPEPARGAS